VLLGTLRIGWGYRTQTFGEFRAVQVGTQWYAFDRGEHPEIDGVRFKGPRELPPRTNLEERMQRPVERVSPADFTEVFGRLEVEHSQVELATGTYIPWLELREPELRLLGARHWAADGTSTTTDLSPNDLAPAFPVISSYLERLYPERDVAQVLRRGLAPQYAMSWAQLPILALQMALIGAMIWLLLSGLRRRKNPVQSPASDSKDPSTAETGQS
jgi:hypothetical protein